MQPSLIQSLRQQSPLAKIFLAIIALAIIARIFTLFTMPDAPLSDTLHHMFITKYIIQNHAIPFNGIPEAGVLVMPLPLYHIIMAIPFTILQIPFNLATARIFPFIFSALQLALSYLVLKKLFPKHWILGLAFTAIHPVLTIFGAVNYQETLVSVLALLCFYIYLEFRETGKNRFLIAMPFCIALLALSKESALALVPVFFLAFLYTIWRKRPANLSKQWAAKTLYFAIASVLLSSAWFLANFLATGRLSSNVSYVVQRLGISAQLPLTLEAIFLMPLHVNASFWFFLQEAISKIPFGISPETAFVAFSLVTFPILALLAFGLAKGLAKGLASKKNHAFVLLLLCIISASVVIGARTSLSFIHSRNFAVLIPLLAIAFTNAFKEMPSPNWRKAFAFLFVLVAIYSAGFSAFYAMHFNEDYNNHLPLYEFAKTLPQGSEIAITSNKARQLRFISGKLPIAFQNIENQDQEAMLLELNGLGATHIAQTCYKKSWNSGTLARLAQEGSIKEIFSDKCSTLYEIEK